MSSKIHYITKRLVPAFETTKCPHSVTRVNRLGFPMVVPCGYCETCLKTKRNELVTRLKWLMEDKSTLYTGFATYTYGNALIYDDKKHEWRTDYILPTLPAISKDDIHSKTFEYDTKGFFEPLRLNIHDCNKQLKSRSLMGIVFPRDLQNTLKKIRVRFHEKYGEKYNIKIKFQALAHYGNTYGRTFAPHFHVLFFLVSEDETTQRLVKECPLLLDAITQTFKEICLNSWIFAERFFDKYKQRYCGKDIEDIKNGNVSCYVTRYVSRQHQTKTNRVVNLFPVKKWGSKNLGYSFLDNPVHLANFNNSLRLAMLTKTPFVVKYKDNNFDKRFSNYVLYKYLLKHFGVTSSQYTTFLRMQNECIKVDITGSENLDSFVASAEPFIHEDNGKVYYYTSSILLPRKRNSRYRNNESRKILDRQTISQCTGKRVLYDMHGLSFIGKLDEETFAKCAKLYDFQIANTMAQIEFQIKEAQTISDLCQLDIDAPILSIEEEKYHVTTFGVSHPYAFRLLNVIKRNEQDCKDIISNSEKLEQYHAIKNHYI